MWNEKSYKGYLLDFEYSHILYILSQIQQEIVVCRGGTRSGKTITILQLLIRLCFLKRVNIGVCRATYPALRFTVMRDFEELLTCYELWHLFKKHGTNHTYTNIQTGSVFYFLAFDSPQKTKGGKLHYIDLEEANEISYDIFRQLNQRLESKGQMFLSFNPDDENVWINTEIEQKRKKGSEFELIKSSYKDNSFLNADQIARIEWYKEQDPMYFKVFGEGEYGNIGGKVYPKFNVIDKQEFDNVQGNEYLGLDYGDNDPTSLVHIKQKSNKLYVNELLYKSGLLHHEKAIDVAIQENNIDRNINIYADHYPSDNQKLRNLGYSVFNADKDITQGIRFVKALEINVTSNSVNGLKELRNYSYQQRSDNSFIEKPIDLNNHFCDAMRYAVYTPLKNLLYNNNIKVWN